MFSVPSQVSHEFPINFNPSNPFCNGKSEKVTSDLENKIPKLTAPRHLKSELKLVVVIN